MLLVLICMNHVFKFHYTTVLVSDRLLYIGLSEVYTHQLSGMLENAYRYSSNIWLDPYFLGNRSLLRKGLLELKKAQEKRDKEGPFAYSSTFYEKGIEWHEDVWSKRLCHSICGNIVDENKLHIEFTGKGGGDIGKDENARVYRFHRAPDLTITKKHLHN